MSTSSNLPISSSAECPASVPSAPKPPGPRIGHALLVRGIFYVVVFGVSIVAAIGLMVSKMPVDGALLTLLGQVTGWPLALWLGLLLTRRSWRDSYAINGFSPRILPGLLVAAFGGAFVMHGLASLIPMPPVFRQAFENLAKSNPYILFACVSVLAPITEELFFRGWMLRGFLANYSVRKAICLTAFIFGAFHLNPWQGVACFPLGLALGWLVVRTGSLAPGMIVHFVVNFTASYLLGPVAVLLGHDPARLEAESHLPWDVLAGGCLICLVGVAWVRNAARAPCEAAPVAEAAAP